MRCGVDRSRLHCSTTLNSLPVRVFFVLVLVKAQGGGFPRAPAPGFFCGAAQPLLLLLQLPPLLSLLVPPLATAGGRTKITRRRTSGAARASVEASTPKGG